MRFWLLEPQAHAQDPYWQDRPRFARVIVRAASPARARAVAARLEEPEMQARIGNETVGVTAGLLSAKLYRLIPLAPDAEDPDGAGAQGPEEIVRADPAQP